MKISKILLTGLIISFFSSSCCMLGTKTATYRDDHIIAGEIRCPLSYYFPHIDSNYFLTIHGKTYTHVYGGKPRYLKISGLNSILFVTEDRRDHFTYHVLNLINYHDIKIDGHRYNFGVAIGNDVNAKYSDYIDKANGNEIVIAMHRGIYKNLLTLDLGLRKVVREEYFEYDNNGLLIEHKINPGFFPLK